MATLGGVRATYFRSGRHYVLRWQAPAQPSGAPRSGRGIAHVPRRSSTPRQHRYGPDVIGLLADNTSYGVTGDHGGAQESVQRIPIVFYGAGIKAGAEPRGRIRSVDILPTILRELGIAKTHWMDGRSFRLR